MFTDVTPKHPNRHLLHHDRVLTALVAGLRAAGPAESVESLAATWTPPEEGDLIVLGFGKSAGTMLQGLIGAGLPIEAGCVVTKDGYAPCIEGFDIREASHPEPDERGLDAARTIESFAFRASATDHVVCLVSGGGSALLPAPVEGITLADLRATHRLLISSGRSICGINAVRKHLSRLKGGGLARAIHPAAHSTVIVSDVVGNRLDVIASGPTVPDLTTFEDALKVVDDLGARDKLPASVLERLKAGHRGDVPETAKSGEECFENSTVEIVADSATALDGAYDWIDTASSGAGRIELVSEPITGEAKHAARRWISRVSSLAEHRRDPFWVLGAGETEVTVDGAGFGGRCQEFALAAAIELEASTSFSHACIGILATDGTDGPSGDTHGAAGAVVDPGTVSRICGAGLDPSACLESHDSYVALKEAGDLISLGPTGTNVNDVVCTYVIPG